MATAFNELKFQLMNGNVDFDNDTFKIALMSSAFVPNIDTQLNWSDVSSNEITGTGYTAGGETLQNVTLTKNLATDRTVLDADDVSIAGSTITARYWVIYKDTGTPSTSTLVGYQDFGADESTDNSAFNIRFNENGVLNLA